MTSSYGARPWLKHYDQGVPTTLKPYPSQVLHHFLQESARDFPEAVAIVSSAHLPVLGRRKASLTYRQLDSQSSALAAALLDKGIKKGDRVALIMPNCAQFVIAFYAILKAGAVVCALNPTYPAAKLRDHLVDCGANTVIVLSLYYNLVKQIQPETAVRNVIVTNIKDYLPRTAAILFTIAKERKDGHRIRKQRVDLSFKKLVRGYAGHRAPVEIRAEDLAIFQYTGGTTGVPKAAKVTHQALVCNTLQNRAWVQNVVKAGHEAFLCAIPLFHVYGMVAVMSLGVVLAARLLMVPNPREIDEVLQVIDHYKATMFVGVPAMCNAIINHRKVIAGKYKLRSIKAGFCGSAPLLPETQARFEALTSGPLIEGYGLSESPTVVCGNPLFGPKTPGSIGVPYPDVEVRVVSLDDELSDVPFDKQGELVIQSPNMMIGYHNMPAETENALRLGPDGKKWLYTGDIVRMDEHGYLYVIDRKKDMALIGGFNVYPTNVEKVFLDHPAVQEIGVAAVPHPNPERSGQETLKAWVVLKPGCTVTDKELIEFGAQKLAQYEIPRRIQFVESLPKTLVGKVLRRELIRMEMESRQAAPEPPEA